MSTPSLIIVPARYKSGLLYSQLPTTGAGDFTVTRALDTATRVTASGLIASVASGIPRLDYFASGGVVGCPALLVEPSGSNLALQSENFGTTWTPNQLLAFGSGSVLNTTGTLDPYGTNVADLIVANTTSAQHRFDQTTVSVSGSYVFSTFLKSGGYDFSKLRIGLAGAVFNLLSGTISSTDAGIVSSIQPYGNGWYRCIISKAASSANEVIRINMQPTSGTADFAGDGTSGIYVFGAQYESGSVATSYIPTTTASVTRNADVISVSGAVSGSIGQTEGSIYAEVNIQKLLGTTQRAFIDIGQSGNRIFLGYGNALTNQIRFLVQTSSGGLVDFQSATTTTGTIRIAVGYKNSDSVMYINGVRISPIANGSFTSTLTSLSNIYLGSSLSGTDFLNDKINAIALYNTRLSNDALMLLSIQGNDTYLPQAVWNYYINSRTGSSEIPDCLYTRHADLLDV